MRVNLTYARAIAASIACTALALAFHGSLLASIRSAGTAAPARVAAVRGVVWNADSTPLPNAHVRLRNLQTGRIDATATTTEVGQFAFDRIESGAYLTELVDDNGRVLAVGQSFRVEPGETIATFVRLASRQPWYSGIFVNTAAAVISAASSAGVTAIGSQAPPVSPQ